MECCNHVQWFLRIKNDCEGYFRLECSHFLAFCFLNTALRKQFARSIESTESSLRVGRRGLVS